MYEIGGPEVFRWEPVLVDGKLCLNLSLSIQELWEEDMPGYIAPADANWPKLLQGEL